jgi:hypothetical protein
LAIEVAALNRRAGDEDGRTATVTGGILSRPSRETRGVKAGVGMVFLLLASPEEKRGPGVKLLYRYDKYAAIFVSDWIVVSCGEKYGQFPM